MLRAWLKRLEGRWAGDMVTVEQLDGTARSFAAEVFWQQLFIGEVAAATGEAPDSAVHNALMNATPAARARITEMILADGGDFLIRATADDFGNVADAPEDLSEGALRGPDSREDRF